MPQGSMITSQGEPRPITDVLGGVLFCLYLNAYERGCLTITLGASAAVHLFKTGFRRCRQAIEK